VRILTKTHSPDRFPIVTSGGAAIVSCGVLSVRFENAGDVGYQENETDFGIWGRRMERGLRELCLL
jgi:hypothetical protein